jgi:hypothetical protein
MNKIISGTKPDLAPPVIELKTARKSVSAHKNIFTSTETEHSKKINASAKVSKIFNQIFSLLARFPWVESVIALGAGLVATAFGGHILLSITLSFVVLILLLACDNICFICF